MAARVPIDELLVHADFVRRVARDLVGGAAGADELAQAVWLRALERGPERADSLRGWLRRTAQRVLANERRRSWRQRRRESAAARPEAVPSVDEILAREQVREAVVRAVLALDEPFRQTLLLRYWDGLPPRAIAARLGVPVATVRSRTARALERLRATLDDRHGGERAIWMTALLPWVGSVPGWIAMKKVTAAAMALLVLAFSFAVLVPTMGDGSAPEPATPRAAVVAGPGPAVVRAAGDAAASDPARTGLAVAIEPPAAPLVYPADRGRGTIRGVVVDEAGAARAGVAVTATPHLGNLPPMPCRPC